MIEQICKKYNIENYTINEDGSIDVNGNVDLSSRLLKRLPLLFNRVSGFFDCSDNELTTLEGSPKYVGSDFNCTYNKLTSLKYGPEYVGEDFLCSNNQLISLEGSPEYVGINFYCNETGIYDLKGISYEIDGFLFCTDNPISTIINSAGIDLIRSLNSYSVIKNRTISLKRLKYVAETFGLKINLEDIEKYYKIV